MGSKNFNRIIELILLTIAIISSLSLIAYSVPNSLTLQGKLTNLAGASQVGTFNFTFRIYDAAANGNELWSIPNLSVATDANGVYDVILGRINLSFADQYYLGIAVQGENESVPRINLTSSPYSFRANTSELLNPNASYVVRNLSVTGNLTAGTSLFVDTTNNLVGIGNPSSNYLFQVASGTDGRSVNLSNVLFVNGSSGNVGIGTANPTTQLQIGVTNQGASTGLSVDVGSWNAQAIGIRGYMTSGFARFVNQGSASNVVLDIRGNAQTGDYFQINSGTGINSGDILVVKSGGNVGIGTTTPGQALHVVGSANISQTLNAPVINTTLATQNLTISSAAGSVIIRLG